MTILNSLLHPLRLRPQRSKWDPPPPLSRLLASPLQWLITILYHALLSLRGRPFSVSPHRRPIRVVVLSDTHGQIPEGGVPDGDVLIHAGDLSGGDGTWEEVEEGVRWLGGLGHRFKILVAGNHDGWFDEGVRRRMEEEGGGKGEGMEWCGVRYLQWEMVELEFEGGRRLNVFGAPGVPRCGDWKNAFQYDDGTQTWKGKVPDETDILVTHTPPRFHRDLNLGCPGLLEEVWRVKPKLHVFGHVHWGHGREAVYFDEGQRAYESVMARTGNGFIYDLLPSRAWVDAVAVVWYGFISIVWKYAMLGPGSNNGGLMVNAAVMYGNTGRVTNPVQVVDL